MRISDWSSDVCSSDLFAPRNERLIRPSSARRTLRRRTATLGAAATRGNQVIDRIQGMAQLRGGFGGHWHRRQTFDQRRVRVRSEEHTSELQSLMRISYAVFCLKKKKKQNM